MCKYYFKNAKFFKNCEKNYNSLKPDISFSKSKIISDSSGIYICNDNANIK